MSALIYRAGSLAHEGVWAFGLEIDLSSEKKTDPENKVLLLFNRVPRINLCGSPLCKARFSVCEVGRRRRL